MAHAILGGPVVVVRRVREPFREQPAVVRGVAANSVHLPEALRPRRPANPVALMEEAEPGVGHVLANQMGRAGDGQEVLGIAGLRAAHRADLTRGPRLTREPFDRVEAVLLFPPAERAVADPGP